MTPLVMVAVVVAATAIGLFIYVRGSGAAAGESTADVGTIPAAPIAAAPQSTPPPAPVWVPPANAKFGPHKQTSFPALPFGGFAPARPPEIVRSVYVFAAEHPEVLGYVPCYCGCERSGHRGNDDCFVTARAANGDVSEWEPHGMT